MGRAFHICPSTAITIYAVRQIKHLHWRKCQWEDSNTKQVRSEILSLEYILVFCFGDIYLTKWHVSPSPFKLSQVSNKAPIIDFIIMYDALHKRTLYLDAIGKGLDVLRIKWYPCFQRFASQHLWMMENYYLWTCFQSWNLWTNRQKISVVLS